MLIPYLIYKLTLYKQTMWMTATLNKKSIESTSFIDQNVPQNWRANYWVYVAITSKLWMMKYTECPRISAYNNSFLCLKERKITKNSMTCNRTSDTMWWHIIYCTVGNISKMVRQRSAIYFHSEYLVSNATILDKHWKVLHHRKIKWQRSCDIDLCAIYQARWRKIYCSS